MIWAQRIIYGDPLGDYRVMSPTEPHTHPFNPEGRDRARCIHFIKSTYVSVSCPAKVNSLFVFTSYNIP